MAITSNAAELVRELKGLAKSFNFEATIEGKSLGRDLAGVVAEGIAARSIDKEAGATVQWDPNKEPYLSWKLAKYNVGKPNIRTGQMLSLESLLGRTSVSTHEVQMVYGTNRPPTRSSASSYFDPKTDGMVTDTQKAEWCSETRPFYELDNEIADAVMARIRECCEQHLIRGGR